LLQLWWGHRIPAYFAQRSGEGLDRNDAEHADRWFVARSQEEARTAAAAKLGCSEAEVSERVTLVLYIHIHMHVYTYMCDLYL
jgi:valyl-tRNA synthetase